MISQLLHFTVPRCRPCRPFDSEVRHTQKWMSVCKAKFEGESKVELERSWEGIMYYIIPRRALSGLAVSTSHYYYHSSSTANNFKRIG